uniref:Uncharacterized protein n=3 Tax=Oryza TaxID=4527 RepID=Q10JR9_ORYSJ|nr:hypothetical protein [Oryza sativa Japonica Group]ABF96558.1 hypothetical protein LOC_Os03g29690 [Oryza sativa Japonica Group]
MLQPTCAPLPCHPATSPPQLEKGGEDRHPLEKVKWRSPMLRYRAAARFAMLELMSREGRGEPGSVAVPWLVLNSHERGEATTMAVELPRHSKSVPPSLRSSPSKESRSGGAPWLCRRLGLLDHRRISVWVGLERRPGVERCRDGEKEEAGGGARVHCRGGESGERPEAAVSPVNSSRWVGGGSGDGCGPSGGGWG